MQSLKLVVKKWFDSTAVKYWELNCIISVQLNPKLFFPMWSWKELQKYTSKVLLRQAASVHLQVNRGIYVC